MSFVCGQLLLGWLLADLFTGIFHWWEDRFGNVEWPLLGAWLIAPNRLHHIKPLAFAEHGFLARNAASMLGAAVIGGAWVLLNGPSLLILTAASGAGMANEVHRFAHQPSAAPTIIKVLQQTGLIQSPKGHSVHHRPPMQSAYCVLTDWLNPFLEALQIWQRLERLLSRVA